MPKYAVVQLLEQCGRWEAKADGGWMRDYDGGAYHIKWHPGPGAGLLCDTFHVANTVFPEGDRRRNAFFDLEARPVGNNPGTRQADRRQLDIAADFARELARLVIDGRPVLYGSEPNALAVANPLNDERIKREQQDGGAAVLKKLSDSKVAIDKLLADAEKSRIYLRQIHPRLVARVKDIEGLLNRHKEKAIGSGGPDPRFKTRAYPRSPTWRRRFALPTRPCARPGGTRPASRGIKRRAFTIRYLRAPKRT